MVSMGSTLRNSRRLRYQAILAVVSGLLVFATPSFGQNQNQSQDRDQGLDYVVDLMFGVSRTDNIFLLSDPDTFAETVYQASPQVSLDYTNNRIIFNGRYRLDYYNYKTLNTDNQLHQYDVSMSNELIEDAIYFDLGGAKTQSVVDPDAIIPPGSLQISNNLVDREDYYVSPRLNKTFSGNVTTIAEYRYVDTNYDNIDTVATIDSINENVLVSVDNLKRQDGLTYLLAYEWEESDYDNAAVLPWEYQKAGGELGFWTNNSLRMFAGGGKESAWDDPVDRSLQDGFWEAGFELLGSGRFRAEFAAGERSFGDSWRGDVELRFRRGELQFRYEQLPTTMGQDRYSAGLLDPNDPNDLLANPNSAERFISNRGEVRLSLAFRRSNLDVVLFDEDRTGRFLADGTALPDQAQQGATLTFNLQSGARTEFVGEGSLYKRSTEESGEVDYLYGRLAFNYDLLARLTFSLAYEYGKQASAIEATAFDYDSNMISLFVIYTIRN